MSIIKYTTKYVFILLALSACHRGMICPAFQSSFILDDSVRITHFSLFEGDTTAYAPKEFVTDKSRYGIMSEVSYPKKYNSIKTIEMVTIFPPGEPQSQDSAYVDPLNSGDPMMAPADSVNTPMIVDEEPQ
ncbi:hypothetical protein [Tunicatimonas pelagia]|uniref:hypothetical protein n=1 Tax=Tunicatimonas pelagia TaxID=931531 RepID=UPI0026668F76|nr:hypothetical protein [Tunicatimonas pelagia]WKN43220.1 hypothetical protein P0M28_29700 [Tunicatimonas pelagia]